MPLPDRDPEKKKSRHPVQVSGFHSVELAAMDVVYHDLTASRSQHEQLASRATKQRLESETPEDVAT